MNVISFLGAGPAFVTRYQMPDGRSFDAPYFPVALAHAYPSIGKLFVFVTRDARAMHFDKLVGLCKDCLPPEHVQAVDIPDGRDEPELWAIFQKVADAVAPGDEILFDITHGLRSLPFLSFLAAAYVRSVKGVKVKGVLYGALELRDKTVEPNVAPVVDLTRFVTLLDWLTAAHEFAHTGNASELADLLKDPNATPQHLAAAAGDRRAQEVAGWLRGAAAAVEDVSEPLRLVRPLETMQAALLLERRLETTREGIEHAAKPFALIADQVAAAYTPFGLNAPLDPANRPASLRTQRSLLRWYVKREQYIQAATLAREWLVSYVAYQFGWDVIQDRELAEHLLNAEAKLQQQRRGLPLEPDVKEGLRQAVDLWNDVADLRNDLAHLGFRKNPRPVKRIIAAAQGLPAKFDLLPLDDMS